MIGQAPDTGRAAAPDWQIEDLFRDFRHAVEDRPAAGQRDTGIETLS